MPNIITEDAKGSMSQSYSVFKEIVVLGRWTERSQSSEELESWLHGDKLDVQRGYSINTQHINKSIIGGRILNGFGLSQLNMHKNARANED